MKLRMTGTAPECAAAVAALAAGFVLREVSDFYPNRGTTVLGRVYVDAEPRTEPVGASAERTDQVLRGELPGGER